MRRTATALATTMAAGLGLGVALVAIPGMQTASAQSGFTVSAAQLKTNQNISSAAVLRSNRALNYLVPIRTTATDNADTGKNGVKRPGGSGWNSSQIANGAIVTAKIGNDQVTRSKIDDGLLAQWAVVSSTGSLVRDQGATAAALTGAGEYQVSFTQNISQCAYQATIASSDATTPTTGEAVAFSPSANTVEVRTFDSGGTASGRPFHLTVNC